MGVYPPPPPQAAPPTPGWEGIGIGIGIGIKSIINYLNKNIKSRKMFFSTFQRQRSTTATPTHNAPFTIRESSGSPARNSDAG